MSDYATLQADIIEYLKDTQVDAAKARDFIRLAEAKLQRDLLVGGSVPHHMLARLETVTDANSLLTLPNDYAKTRNVTVGGDAARYVAPSFVPSQAPGRADAEVVLDYYQDLPPLTDIAPTNWLLKAGYDCYLWAVCLNYVAWGHEVEVLQMYNGYYQDALNTVRQVHEPQPRGYFGAAKAQKRQAMYTVIGLTMRFA